MAKILLLSSSEHTKHHPFLLKPISALVWKRTERKVMFNCKDLTYINMERNRRAISLGMCSSQELLTEEQSSTTYAFAILFHSLQNIRRLNHLWSELFITWMKFGFNELLQRNSSYLPRIGCWGFFLYHITEVEKRIISCLSGRMPWRHSLANPFPS